MAKMLDKQKLLTEEEHEQIKQLEKKLETLIEGGYVGMPKTKADLQ
jgi:mannitol/fructose-specific phosphotransferase system IIA component (Ntr-type)